MIRIKSFLYFFMAGVLLLGAIGCKKYLAVNKNLNDPTAVPVSTLLTSTQRSLGGSFTIAGTLGLTLGNYVHQITGRTGADRYGIRGDNLGWDGLYIALSNLDVIVNQATAEGRYKYAGVAKIMKAYFFSLMVDVWGDIPFSEFNSFKPGNISQPVFDNDAEIYPKLLALLDEGIADINNPTPNASVPAADDLFYAGNTARWVKAANTIKLKLYTQVRLVQNVSAEVTALLANPSQLISSQAESFMLPFGPFVATDDRNPGYGIYTATQRGGQLVSPWLYEIMKGRNTGIYQNLTDPRIPYYIYNQKSATATPENCTEYRDGGFVTIVFGSNGICRDGSNSNTYSLPGIYPTGGRYDDGAGTAVVPATAGTGAAPARFLTYADRLYLEAELILAGLAPGNAQNVFSAALTASFEQVDYIITNFVKPTNQTVPLLASQAAATSYRSNVIDEFVNGNATKKMEHVMTQKWISQFGANGVDNYNDFRRTRFPIMFNPGPANAGLQGFGPSVTVVQPPVGGNPVVNPQNPVPVICGTDYPWSLPWPQGELNLNGNAPSQKVPSTYKVFWQP